MNPKRHGGGSRPVVRPDDRRRLPHSPERRAAIAAGAVRAEFRRAQGRLAQAGLAHVFTPWRPRTRSTARVIDPLAEQFGGCWACWTARAALPHIEEA